MVLAIECFFSFDIFEIHSDASSVVNVLWVCWRFMGVLGFDLVFVFLNYVFFCVHPWCDFLWYKFFIFQDSVWLVKKFWCVHCCSIYQFYWLSYRCRWICSVVNFCHKLVVSTSFWSWILNASSVSTSLKYASLLFWFVIALWVCWLFLEFWGLDFGVYVSEICLFLCSTLMRFFVVQIFSFSRTVCG